MAGIYIPGMEMPTSCRDCRFCSGEADTEYGVCAWCAVDGNARDAYTKQDCPLVPVPDHGRLGDLDALAKKCDAPNWCVWLNEIENAPTIIPADKEGAK